MPDITILPANLATLVIESFLYGINLLLFISTVYFLATKRTLAGARRTAKHHFTSLVFLGVTCVFLLVTGHWTIVIYQAFYGFIHLGGAGAADTFYADLSQPSEVSKEIITLITVLLGDCLITYRLWIIWERNRCIVVFPICTLIGGAVVSAELIFQMTKWESRFRGALWNNQSKPWEAVGFGLSILNSLYCTGFIMFRISRVAMKLRSESRLTSFLSILVESAVIQTLWLAFSAIAAFANSDMQFIGIDDVPSVIGIANLLIHARIGLGWSPGSAGQR